MKLKKFLTFILTGALMFSFGGCTPKTPKEEVTRVEDSRNLSDIDFTLMNLAGTDDVGRRIETMDNYKSGNHNVGLFYSLWLGQHQYQQTDIYNISALLATDEGIAALQDDKPNKLSRPDEFHFSSEPLYGYYNMGDPWVLTRHIELLTLAGIDYLCFDATNSILYQTPTFRLLDLLLKYQSEGWNVPKAMFYTNSFSGTTVKKIYNDFYQTEKYNSIWWAPNDKPMIVGVTQDSQNASDQTKYNPNYSDYITDDMIAFFDVAESQWPNGDLHMENGLPWMSWQYPQKIHDGRKTVSVSVAQHSNTRIQMSFMDPESSRGYDYKTKTIEKNFFEGKNFANEWETVFENESKIENVLVTGFNEWMAIKTRSGGQNHFCDVYNVEYSRDLEMSKDANKDNFFMQLIQNVRKYKFEPSEKFYKWKQMTVDISSENSLVMFDHATANYVDFKGDALARDYDNAVGTFKYTDSSNRNDIAEIKVLHDKNNLYFYVKTVDDITAYNGTDKNWMNLLYDTTFDKSGFEGYNYIINKTITGDGTSLIEKSTGGYNFEKAGEAQFKVYGNVMAVQIPLSALGLTEKNCRIEFKVADNVTHYDDIMDYYVSGDSAPIGRLSYSYGK